MKPFVRSPKPCLPCSSGRAGVAQAQSSMPLTELSAGMYRIEAEVAATPTTAWSG
jgi:hypothetical protein